MQNNDREKLAEHRYNRDRAKHKGRCHLSNQKRRQIAIEQSQVYKKQHAKKLSALKKYKEQVRAYWNGLILNHPS